ncbi:MAG: asparaginase [Sulfolobales archaeon]
MSSRFSGIKVLVLGVGGTIASTITEKGLAPSFSALEVVKRALGGDLPQNLEASYMDLMRIDSSLRMPEHWVRIARAIYNSYEDYDAFLVLHGTDTMAYTASALAFALRGLRKPVVLTGSMRSVEEKDSDAPKNLKGSLEFIKKAVELGISGVFLVFNNKVILGVRASKISSLDFDAFTSVNYPYVAMVYDTGVEVRHIPRRLLEEPGLKLDDSFDSSVLVLKVFPGMRPEFLDVAVSHGVRGLVIEAFGLGGLSSVLIEKLKEISEKVPVILTSQPVFGGVDIKVYEVGRRLLDTEVIPACDMSKECAIIKLMWALGKTKKVSEVRHVFLKNYEDEVRPCL